MEGSTIHSHAAALLSTRFHGRAALLSVVAVMLSYTRLSHNLPSQTSRKATENGFYEKWSRCVIVQLTIYKGSKPLEIHRTLFLFCNPIKISDLWLYLT